MGIWFPTINPLKARFKLVPIRVCYGLLEFFFEEYKISPSHFQKRLDLIRYEHPILGLSLGSLGEKWHLDVVLIEKHRVYYKEGSGASFWKLRVM